MVTEDRWEKAQASERSWWEGSVRRIRDGQNPGLDFFQWRADNFMRLIREAFPDNPPSFEQARVVEIGSGAVGVAAFLSAKERYAYDPLCDFYASRPELIKNRNPEVVYKKSRGEEILHDDSSVDLVMIENVIDHVHQAEKVMTEIHRVLKPQGILYLTVNLHPGWGAFLHRILAKLNIDTAHPHTFTLASFCNFLIKAGFDLKYHESESYAESKAKDKSSASSRDRLKATLGLSEYLFSSISIKP